MPNKIIFEAGPIKIETENINGREFVRVVQPDFVAILAIHDGNVILERIYRKGVKREIVEIPAGYLEKGESPEKAAARELEEETGYRPSRIKLMFKAYQAPARTTSMIYFCLAEGLTQTKPNLEEDEKSSNLTAIKVSLKEFESMITRNEIEDQMTIAAYEYYKNHMKK